MLTREENELLTRVGPGAVMGEFMRQYWMPALLSSELPEPDGATVRVGLLGEDLVAFRDTQGRVGMLGAHCSHRGAPLFYGRNEESGLRCIYHGWKYDFQGQCVDMPNEVPENDFKTRIRHKAYPCREQGGVIWAYMGRLKPPPPLPELEWTLIPENQRCLAKRVQFCNYAQALEGDIDQSHNSFLHTSVSQLKENPRERAGVETWRKKDKHPHFAVSDTNCGVLIGARRTASEETCYWRLTQFILPFHTMTGPYGENPTRQTRAWVPMDDGNTMLFAINFHPLRPLTEKEVARLRAGSGAGFVGDDNFLVPANEPGGAWWPKARKENDYFYSRDLQRTKLFSGIPEFWAQDAAVQEGMGPIYDRTQEHLGLSDSGIVRVRRRLIETAKAFMAEGAPPPGALNPEWYRVRGAAALLLKDADWIEATGEIRQLVPGTNPSAPDR
jgi:nitrite reductase/ring-hydroxylating ferredoxin subunit